MGFLAGLFIFGLPSVIIAEAQGFKSLRWLIAFGPIGLIVVAFLPSAKVKGLSSEKALKRAEKANSIGGWMAGLNFALGCIFSILSLVLGF